MLMGDHGFLKHASCCVIGSMLVTSRTKVEMRRLFAVLLTLFAEMLRCLAELLSC